MDPSGYTPASRSCTRSSEISATPCDVPGSAPAAASGTAADRPDRSSTRAANSARTPGPHYIRLVGDRWLAFSAGPGERIPEDVNPANVFYLRRTADECARLQNDIDRTRRERQARGTAA